MKKKLNYDYCQAAPVLEWMSQKWALVVMLRIEEYEKESIRFSELFRTIPQVSEKVLASTLDYLLQEGLVTRERFEEVPPRVEYSLTPIAKDFLREISYVIEWGQLHIEQIVKGRKFPHSGPRRSGRAVRCAPGGHCRAGKARCGSGACHRRCKMFCGCL